MNRPYLLRSNLAALVGVLLGSSVASPGPLVAADQKSATAKIEFNQQIRPILTENCFSCHGVDSASRKASLRLDLSAEATAPRKDAKPAIVPGKPDESELIARIMTTDEDDVMPPIKSHKVLLPEQKALLKQWIAEGAVYQEHWSLIAPTRPQIPTVKDKRWVKTPIDAFILARLEQKGLKPAPEADRRTLARLSLDLIGLPPTPEEVEAFVKDKSPNAYEVYVDKLLASPHWGEHRGRYWLDAARYADTHGIHFDNYREVWAYRDWVIQALNKNMPFDEFTIEQLAGDLLPNATLEQKIATGFNRNHITSNEGGLIDEEYYVLYTRDRTETTAQVFMGLTAGCAVCHDHKYDRFSQKEFYQLSAFFNNTTQTARDGNIKDTPPIISVALQQDRARADVLPAEKKLGQARLEERTKTATNDFDSWVAANPADKIKGKIPADALTFHAPLTDGAEVIKIKLGAESRDLNVTTNITWQEGAISEKAFTTTRKSLPEIPEAGDFERDQKYAVAAWVKLAPDANGGALIARMDDPGAYRGWDFWFEGGRPGTHIIHNWPENALKVVSKKALEANRWTHVCINYDGSSKASGVTIYIDGELQETEVQKDALTDSIRTTVPLKIGQRNKEGPLEKAGIQDLRFYSRVLKQEETKELSNSQRLAWIVSKEKSKRTEAEQKELFTRYLISFDREYQEATAHIAKLDKEDADIKARGTVAAVSNEKPTPPEAYILFRGEYDKRRDKVIAETPAAMPPFPSDYPRNRLGFAKWLLRPEHPLTARVTVNRYWQELFGNGIVRTTGDLGVSGEMPSNPELLDWMALEFREKGWDIKQFFKLMVTSAAYRQMSTVTPEKLSKDPQNILVSRGPRFRMDAEMVRDYALSTSGLLVPKIGGPSVKPYQPEGVWEAVAMPSSNTRDYKQDTGESLYRRSMYTFWKRAAPPASMDVFNAPNRETCAVKRERTNTPLQALATLNDVQFVEAARNLAEHALKDAKEPSRLDYMARRLLARSLRSEEKKIVDGVLKDLLSHYKSAPAEAEALLKIGESKRDTSLDQPTLAAYTMVANQLMNLDEVLNK